MIDKKPFESYLLHLDTYRSLLKTQAAEREGSDKHLLLIDIQLGLFPEKARQTIQEYCSKVQKREGDADFDFVILIRILYLLENDDGFENSFSENYGIIREIIDNISNSFRQFPFWPREKAYLSTEDDFDLSKVCFWSENHIFMFLSTAHLFHQWSRKRNQSCKVTRLEESVLRIYLQLHLEMNGVFECNSHVYLPFTMTALLNLYDFSQDSWIRNAASSIMETITKQILLGTSTTGVASLSCGGRAFPRTRQRTFNHNINQFVRLLIGNNPDSFGSSALGHVLATSSWFPDESIVSSLETSKMKTMESSPKPNELRQLLLRCLETQKDACSDFSGNDVSMDDLIPLFWSAGLLVDPSFHEDTKKFVRSRGLAGNSQLNALTAFFGLPSLALHSYPHFSKGQSYCGFVMDSYKLNGGIVLTSLRDYNVGKCSYQQLPWIANIDGIPVWCQSGTGSESIAGFGITNTHNPLCKQFDNILVVAYNTPSTLRSLIVGNLLGSRVRLFWPEPFFDEQRYFSLSPSITKDTWWLGRRNQAYVGVVCSHATSLDASHSGDAELRISRDSQDICVPVSSEFNLSV